MRRKIAMILCATMVTTLFTGCGSGTENTAATSTEVEKEETSDNEGEVVSIWHDGDEAIMKVIENQVNEELSDDNITVKFEKKSGLTDQIKLYGSDA